MKRRLFIVTTALCAFLFQGFGGVVFAKESSVKYLLTVDVTPKDSQVKIVNMKSLKYKPGIRLEPGTYELYVSHPGYKPKKTSVVLGGPALPGEPQLVSGTSETTVKVVLDKVQ
jgi:hypothetical protein